MKEAPQSPYPNLIFRETFNSEQEVRKNGWVVSKNTSGGFKDGKVFLAGNSINLGHNFNILAGTPITFRFKCRIDDVAPASTSYFIDFRKNGGAHYISFATSSTIILPGFSEYTIYINGVNSNDTSEIEGEWVDIIITATPAYDIGYSTLGRYNSGGTNSQINFDLIEIYKGTLTASEVANLYNDSWNKEQNFGGGLLIDFDSTNGVLEDKQVGNVVGEQLLPSVSEPSLWNKADCTGTTVDYEGQEDVMEVETTGSSTIYVYKSGFDPGKYLVSVNYFIPEETNISNNSRTPFIRMGNTSSSNGFYLSEKGKWATTTGIVDMTINGSFFVYRATGDIGDKYYLSKISCTKIRENLDVTDVVVKKQGACFNGSTSKIDTGTDMIGTKPITIMGWINPHSFGDGILKNRLIDNGMLYFSLGSNNNIGLTSDNATSVVSDTNSIFINKYYFVAATRGVGGIANFYIGDKSTAPALSGSADQDSGTPVAGSTNILIGSRDVSDRTFDGLIPQLKVVEGILDIDSITRYWSETNREIS